MSGGFLSSWSKKLGPPAEFRHLSRVFSQHDIGDPSPEERRKFERMSRSSGRDGQARPFGVTPNPEVLVAGVSVNARATKDDRRLRERWKGRFQKSAERCFFVGRNIARRVWMKIASRAVVRNLHDALALSTKPPFGLK